jgi:hypothetical protein
MNPIQSEMESLWKIFVRLQECRVMILLNPKGNLDLHPASHLQSSDIEEIRIRKSILVPMLQMGLSAWLDELQKKMLSMIDQAPSIHSERRKSLTEAVHNLISDTKSIGCWRHACWFATTVPKNLREMLDKPNTPTKI